MVVRMKRCPKCGRTSPRDAAVCSGCRSEFAYRASPRRQGPSALPPGARWVAPAPHDSSIAALASIFLVGTGQMYNGQNGKAAFLFVVTAIILLLAAVTHSEAFLGIAAVIWFLSIADASFIASRITSQEPIQPWQWF